MLTTNETTAGARTPKEQRQANRLAKIRQLAALNMTAGAIGAQMGLRVEDVREIANAHGVTIREAYRHAPRPKTPPAKPLVQLQLVKDPRPGDLYPRRRAECANLTACEDAWIEAHVNTNIGEPGACPKTCPGVSP